MHEPVGLCSTEFRMKSLGFSRASRLSSAAMSGPSAPRGTPTMRAPNAAKRANITNHAGSSTNTTSPGARKRRATRSMASVAPAVVTIWSGATLDADVREPRGQRLAQR